jgi:hypothetical protein
MSARQLPGATGDLATMHPLARDRRPRTCQRTKEEP